MDVREISVIVQGPIGNDTLECLKSIRHALPQSEIILSTWEGHEIESDLYDALVYSVDPGGMTVDERSGVLNNVNRQLVSTQAGIRHATRKYILKIRSDMILEDATFLSYFGEFPEGTSEVLEQKLLICDYFTRNHRCFPTGFHPSDWVVFGCRKDIEYYYEVPLQSDLECTWFRVHPKANTVFTKYLSRYTPEQYIFVNFLRKSTDLEYENYYQWTRKTILDTEIAFARCFIVLEYQKQIKIKFSKYNPDRYFERHTLLHHWAWKALYYRYCQNRRTVSWVMYLAVSAIFYLECILRIQMLRMFERLYIKEWIKQFLNRFF